MKEELSWYLCKDGSGRNIFSIFPRIERTSTGSAKAELSALLNMLKRSFKQQYSTDSGKARKEQRSSLHSNNCASF